MGYKGDLFSSSVHVCLWNLLLTRAVKHFYAKIIRRGDAANDLWPTGAARLSDHSREEMWGFGLGGVSKGGSVLMWCLRVDPKDLEED